MKEKVTKSKKGSSPEDIREFLKSFDKEVPVSKLRANLRKVAESRGLIGANLEFHFRSGDEALYYNIYRYAFCGMVPEPEFDPKVMTLLSPPQKSKNFSRSKKSNPPVEKKDHKH